MPEKPASVQFWLPSYPRSGSTFIRALLAAYDSDASLDINELYRFGYTEHDELIWSIVTGLPKSVRSFELEWRYREKYFEVLRTQPRLGRINPIKTHTANITLFGIPAFQFRPSDKGIFVVRHIADVALSYSQFVGVGHDEALDQLLIEDAFVGEGLHTRAEFRGSWIAHTRSWLAQEQPRFLMIRYDDIVEQTAVQLERMLAYLEIPIDQDRVARAVEATRFDRLAAQEAENGFIEYPNRNSRFFRLGKPRHWQDELSVRQAARLMDAASPVLAELGYSSIAFYV